MIALETRRADLYAQFFTVDAVGDAMAIDEPLALRPEALSEMLPSTPLVLAGDGVSRLKKYLSRRGDVDVVIDDAIAPDARTVASLVARRWSADGPTQGPSPSPIYVHPPEATVPVAQGRLRP